MDGDVWIDIKTEACGDTKTTAWVATTQRAGGGGTTGMLANTYGSWAQNLRVKNCALSSVGFSATVQSFQVNEDCQLAGLNVMIGA
jgi:hypothetical protein